MDLNAELVDRHGRLRLFVAGSHWLCDDKSLCLAVRMASGCSHTWLPWLSGLVAATAPSKKAASRPPRPTGEHTS